LSHNALQNWLKSYFAIEKECKGFYILCVFRAIPKAGSASEHITIVAEKKMGYSVYVVTMKKSLLRSCPYEVLLPYPHDFERS